MMKNRISLWIVIALCFATAACSGNDAGDTSLISNPNSASGYDSTAKLPVIAFDHNQHDFGRLTAGENVSYSFHFRNTGSSDLIILGCDATCGCTVADYPHSKIAPGEEGYVTVRFSSAGQSGQQVKEVSVVTNAQPSTVRLRIMAQVY
ncbi:MAG: DUF1573 domain-containing protein [Bacteroidales bacterium]|nr:DUF1573 domain-containing protein [Bacteroidales bacterium]